jgi:hypothetical protein
VKRFNYKLWYLIGQLWLAVASCFGADNRSAAALSLAGYHEFEPAQNSQFVRWIYNPTGSTEDYHGYLVAINTAINHYEKSYTAPHVVAKDGTSLIPVDFTKLSDDPKEILRLLAVWDSLAAIDPHFHERLLVDGEWRIRPARYLEEVGLELEGIFPRLSNGRPKLTLPVAYGPWVLKMMLASIEGGQYLTFRGLTPGKTTLNDYLASRGAPLPKKGIEQLGLISHVTGKARAIRYYQGGDVRPTASRALVFITDDIFDENTDRRSNPFSSLLNVKPDGHEVFVVLPNGWIEFTLFNGNGVLVAEAPMGSPKFLVSDNRVPAPFSPRLHGAISCLRCHAPFDGYQPAQNEVADRIRSFGVLAESLSGDALQQFRELKQIGALYQAKQLDINSVLQDARDGFCRRVSEVTGLADAEAAKIGCGYVSDIYGDYDFKWVDAKIALERAGVTLPKEDPLGIKTMQALIPKDIPPGFYDIEALDTISHLATTSDVVEDKQLKKVPLKIHPRQWEKAVATIQLRILEVKQ